MSWSEPELTFHGFTPWIPRRPVYEPKYELSLYPLENRAHLCTFFLVPPTSFLHSLILPSAFASSILNAILSSPLPSSHSSSSSFLQPTCENIYHPPHLRISPKGRLSSFPYLLPLSRSSLSFHSVFLILSLVCQLSQNTLRHTLPCHLSTLSARMEGKFPTYLPTYRPLLLCQIPPQQSASAPSVSSGITDRLADSPQKSEDHMTWKNVNLTCLSFPNERKTWLIKHKLPKMFQYYTLE